MKWVKRHDVFYDKETGETLSETHEDRPVIDEALRDYFAGQAMQGAAYSCIPDGEINRVVEKALKMADAMLAARDRT